MRNLIKFYHSYYDKFYIIFLEILQLQIKIYIIKILIIKNQENTSNDQQLNHKFKNDFTKN